MLRYALSKTSNDRFPIEFRLDCERTYFDRNTGKDETLIEVIERLDKAGYLLLNSREELIKQLEARGLKAENGWQD